MGERISSYVNGDLVETSQQPHPTLLTLTGSLVEGGACP